jgi:xylan 1,4-beta-xylosidase
MPEALSSRPDPYTPDLVKVGKPGNMLAGGAFYPPKDYAKWEALIEAWARHTGERYGIERASSWLWELWNEPESPYFRGTIEDYCRMYDHFAAAVKRALPKARVGGPHTTDPSWKRGDLFMEKFLEHCRSGVNAVTGEKGAPLDFVAFHAKGVTRLDAQGRVEMGLGTHLGNIRTYAGVIARFPEFAHLPIYIGESDPEGCAACAAVDYPERGYRLTSQFAAYTAASFLRKQDLVARTGGDLQGAVSWAFTFADQPWFNGLRALTTNQVALPVFNTFKLFARLGPRRLAVDFPAMLSVDEIIAHGVLAKPDVGAVATRDASRITVLLWNYHDVAGLVTEPAEVTVQLDGLATGREVVRAVRQYTIDEKSGNSYTQWLALGAPASPTPEQVRVIKAAAEMTPQARDWQATVAGGAQLPVTLPPQSVVLLEVELGAD